MEFPRTELLARLRDSVAPRAQPRPGCQGCRALRRPVGVPLGAANAITQTRAFPRDDGFLSPRDE